MRSCPAGPRANSFLTCANHGQNIFPITSLPPSGLIRQSDSHKLAPAIAMQSLTHRRSSLSYPVRNQPYGGSHTLLPVPAASQLTSIKYFIMCFLRTRSRPFRFPVSRGIPLLLVPGGIRIARYMAKSVVEARPLTLNCRRRKVIRTVISTKFRLYIP